MLYINSASQDTMRTLIDIYKLPKRAPNKIPNILTLGKYVFRSCLHLIPQEITEFFNVSSKTSTLESDLILHIILNAFMVQLTETGGSIKRNGALISRVSRLFETALVNEKPVYDLLGGKDIPRVASEYFKTKLAVDWGLPLSDGSSHAIPAFASPLIAFQAVHVDPHKVITDYKNSQHSLNYLRKDVHRRENLHLQFYGNFNYLLKNLTNSEVTQQLVEGNRLSYYPTLNRILFEREYQLGLASKIAMLTRHYPDAAKRQYYQLLGRLALLPNVNGRLYYLTSMLIGSHDPRIKGGRELKPLTEDGHLARTQKISSALIGMALVTIPVMELCFLHLLKHRRFSFDEDDMNEFIEYYGRIKFKDDPVKPPQPFKIKDISVDMFNLGIKGEWELAELSFKDMLEISVDMFNLGIKGEWELAELSFKDIREILRILNENSFLNKTTLSSIFMRPHEYLQENGYDTDDPLLFDRRRLVNAIANEVEDTHFRI